MGISIKEIGGKIKRALEDSDTDVSHSIFVAIALVLVGTASFGLGRLSASTTVEPSIDTSQIAQVSTGVTGVSEIGNLPEGTVVASKKGTKYHFPWCSGARTIAPENKIVFASIDEAKNAGYTPAANCKGLE